MGIEPTYSAWKAAALPLCYTRTRLLTTPSKKDTVKNGGKGWIRTSELKRGQIYSLLALTTHPPFHKVPFVSFKNKVGILCRFFVALSSVFLYNLHHETSKGPFYRLRRCSV